LLAIVLTLVLGALIGGGVNGTLIGKAGLSFFVVTLGTASLYQGSVSIWSGTKTTYIDSKLVDDIGFGTILGIPVPIWIMAAVFRGGTSFTGGVGGVTGTAVGVVFIGTLQNGLAIRGVSSFWQQVVTGAILVLAVGFDRIQQRRRGTT